jgi:cytochrome c oxidase subunit II
MPDYTNRLFYTFNVPGHYYVLCLEYCGVAHHAMNTEFDVK